MKKILITIVLFCAVCLSAVAQNTIKMKFTGRNQNNEWIPLSYVLVENQTQRWQELAYYPDTIFYMGAVGIDDYMQNEKVQLFQNVPNPFDGVTDFSLQLDKGQNLLIEIYDMNGKQVARYENNLPEGPHIFRATLTSPQTYLLSAKTDNDRLHIKMVNKGNGGANAIEYLGQGSIQCELKSYSKGNSPYPFVPGDWMKYEGYANLCGEEYVSTPVSKVQYQSEIISLIFTLPLPELTNVIAADITPISARLEGNANSQSCGLSERGFYYGTDADNLNNKVVATDTTDGNFQYELDNLTPGTHYYYKAYAQSIMGAGYSNVRSFLTLSTIPTVTTTAIGSILRTSAVGGGNVTSDGGATVTARGVCWSTSQNPTVSNSHTTNGSGTGSFSSSMTGLSPNTTYYVRAYATNSMGTAYGNQVSFTTPALSVPTVTTTSATSITHNSATSGGNVTDDGGASVTARGVCWSTSQNPTISNSHTTNGSGTGSFTSSITGLSANTTYYVRAYATNEAGIGYGNQVSFTTAAAPVDGQPCPGAATVTDYDGNTYNTVKIGSQCWMKQNLKTTHYADGTSISLGSSTSTSTAYRYYPNNNSSNVSTYGYLYNWKAVMRNSSSSSANPSGVQGICPTGWHVPSDAEWTQLTNYVSSQSEYVCGSSNTYIAKTLASTTGWSSSSSTCAVGNNPSANNATGFSAVPAGCYYGYYDNFGYDANFWSATQNNSDLAYDRILFYFNAYVDRYNDGKYHGYSVRCLRDEGGSSATLPTVTTTSATSITHNSATSGGNVTSDGGATVTARGVCWSTSQNPTINNSHTTNGTGTGSFSSSITGLSSNTTYYVRAYATNSAGTAYGAQQQFTTTASSVQPCPGAATVTDVDNNTYNTVQIGNQCWMKENLKTTKFANGTTISLGSSTSTSTATYRYYPNNNSSNVSTYGYLYNWYAVNNGNLCPIGWHVPTDQDFTTLENYLGTNAGGAMKYTGTSYWSSPNTGATNSSGFSAYGAGLRTSNGSFNNWHEYAIYWTSNSYNAEYAIDRCLAFDESAVLMLGNSNYNYSLEKRSGVSVRCLKDEELIVPTSGSATATTCDAWVYDDGGSSENYSSNNNGYLMIYPSVSGNKVSIDQGNYDTESGYDKIYIYDGAGTSGTLLSTLQGTGTISTSITSSTGPLTIKFTTDGSVVKSGFALHVSCVSAAPVDGQPCPGAATVTDYDNNTYNTVKIGNQCWMKQNLKTTHYADGTSISLGSSTSTSTAYRYYPNNSSSNVSTYGYLYNWKTVMRNSSSSSANPSGVQGICPTGWHVPSDAEWTQLTDYVSSQSEYVCGSSNTYIAKALASTTGWSSSSSTCAVGNNPSANNATGFSAVPAGYYGGYYYDFGSSAGFWSATQYSSNDAYPRGLGYDGAIVGRGGIDKYGGFSVRCLRD